MVALVSLTTQFDNLGDQVIGALLVASLSRRTKVLCLSGSAPVDYLNAFRTRVADFEGSQFKIVKGFHALGNAIPAALGSGILVALSPGDIFGFGSASRQQALRVAAKSSFGRVRFLQIGASLSRVDPSMARTLQAMAIRGFISVRDEHSRARAAKHGIDLPLVPDLAFSLPVRPAKNARYMVISFRAHDDVPIEALALRVSALAKNAWETGLEPVLFWQVERDAAVATCLAARTGIEVLNRHSTRPNYEEAAAIYGDTAVIASNRLHALLIAAAHGAIPLAALRSTETKVRGVFEGSGLIDMVADNSAEDLLLMARLRGDENVRVRVAEAFAVGKTRIGQAFDQAVR